MCLVLVRAGEGGSRGFPADLELGWMLIDAGTAVTGPRAAARFAVHAPACRLVRRARFLDEDVGNHPTIAELLRDSPRARDDLACDVRRAIGAASRELGAVSVLQHAGFWPPDDSNAANRIPHG